MIKPTASQSYEFGFDSSADGAFLAVSQPMCVIGKTCNGGSVSIFEVSPTKVALKQTLNNPTTTFMSAHGKSIDISSPNLVVGQPERNWGTITAAGTIQLYTYSGSTWIRGKQMRVTSSSQAANDNLGASVVIYGSYILGGCPGSDRRGTDSGTVFVFNLAGTTVTQIAVISPSDIKAGDRFGTAMAASADRVAIATNPTDFSIRTIHIYRNTNAVFSRVTKITRPSAVSTDDSFGLSLSLASNVLAIGAYTDAAKGQDSGAVHIYSFVSNKWIHKQKVESPKQGSGDIFGFRVLLSGDKLYATQNPCFKSNGCRLRTKTFVFINSSNGNWVYEREYVSDKDGYGASVAAGSNFVAVGATKEDTDGKGLGAAVVYRF